MSKRSARRSALRLIGLASRFGIVGIAATLTYLAMANLAMHFTTIGPGVASVLGYLAGMAVSYLGQSRWTFEGVGGEGRALRFAILSAVGLSISFLAPHAALRLGMPANVGTLVPVLAVPLVSFLAMKWWVFVPRHSS